MRLIAGNPNILINVGNQQPSPYNGKVQRLSRKRVLGFKVPGNASHPTHKYGG